MDKSYIDDEYTFSKESIKVIAERLIGNANRAKDEYQNDKCEFNDGKLLAYHEVLSTLQNIIGVSMGQNLGEYHLDIDVDKEF